MYCFVLHIRIYLYDTNSKETHKFCVCFLHANTRSGRMFGRVLYVQSKHRTGAYLCNIDIFQYTNTKICQNFHKTVQLQDEIRSTLCRMYALVS